MENFDHLEKEKRTISIAKANLYAIILCIPVFLFFGIPYYLIWGATPDSFGLNRGIADGADLFDAVPFLIFIIPGVIIHELIHGVVAARYAKNRFKSIRFGVMWKSLTPYCHCQDPLTVKHYVIVCIAPSILLGLIPGIVSIFIGSLDLLVLSMFFVVSGTGDYMMVYSLRKEKGDDYVQDLSAEAGFYIYRQIE